MFLKAVAQIAFSHWTAPYNFDHGQGVLSHVNKCNKKPHLERDGWLKQVDSCLVEQLCRYALGGMVKSFWYTVYFKIIPVSCIMYYN